MPELPSFLQPAHPSAVLEFGDEAGGAAPSTRRVAVGNLIAQEEDNWCWAAVTQYVLAITRGSSVQQQNVATAHVQRNGRVHDCALPHRKKVGGNCRDDGCNGACNAQHTLRIVLQENGFSGQYVSRKRAPTFQELQKEINADRPVPCRVRWSSGAGHFVLVVGWTIDATGAQLVHVRDPGSAPHGRPIAELVMPHAKFAADYRLSGLRGAINYSYRVN